MSARVAPSSMLRAAVLRILRVALDVAAADPLPGGRGVPAEWDYLSAKQIAELIGQDRDWRTLEYEPPAPGSVLRQLQRLEHEDLVYTWDAGTRQTPAVARHRWALIPDTHPRRRGAAA